VTRSQDGGGGGCRRPLCECFMTLPGYSYCACVWSWSHVLHQPPAAWPISSQRFLRGNLNRFEDPLHGLPQPAARSTGRGAVYSASRPARRVVSRRGTERSVRRAAPGGGGGGGRPPGGGAGDSARGWRRRPPRRRPRGPRVGRIAIRFASIQTYGRRNPFLRHIQIAGALNSARAPSCPNPASLMAGTRLGARLGAAHRPRAVAAAPALRRPARRPSPSLAAPPHAVARRSGRAPGRDPVPPRPDTSVNASSATSSLDETTPSALAPPPAWRRAVAPGARQERVQAGGLAARLAAAASDQLLLAKAWFFLGGASGAVLFPYVNLFLDQRGLPPAQIGLISALRPWVAAPASVSASALADARASHAPLLMLGLAVSSALRAGLPLAAGAGQLFAVLLAAEAFSFFGVLADATVLSNLPRNQVRGGRLGAGVGAFQWWGAFPGPFRGTRPSGRRRVGAARSACPAACARGPPSASLLPAGGRRRRVVRRPAGVRLHRVGRLRRRRGRVHQAVGHRDGAVCGVRHPVARARRGGRGHALQLWRRRRRRGCCGTGGARGSRRCRQRRQQQRGSRRRHAGRGARARSSGSPGRSPGHHGRAAAAPGRGHLPVSGCHAGVWHGEAVALPLVRWAAWEPGSRQPAGK
jgi:hypothetical protein